MSRGTLKGWEGVGPNAGEYVSAEDGFGYACQQVGIEVFDSTALDPDIMGKDIFGKDRLIKVVKGIGEYIDKFQSAWEKNDETDYYRAKLDEALEEVYGEDLHDSFLKRYQFAPEYNYNTGRLEK